MDRFVISTEQDSNVVEQSTAQIMNTSTPVVNDKYITLKWKQDSEIKFENESQDDNWTKYLQYMKDK